jgi:DHA3 family tetracycline resistance protein-like MFS transporter
MSEGRGRHLLPAATVYMTLEAAGALFFYLMATVAAVYRIVAADLDALQLVLVGTVLETTTLVFEVPTGVLADTVGRKASIVTGTFLTGAGFMLEGSIAELPAILAAQVLWGVGYTFISGADVAWITDEVGEERAGRLYVRAAQAGQVAALFGIFGSVALASISLGLPLFVAGALHVALAGFLVVVMPEHHFSRRRTRHGASPRSFLATLRGGLGAVRSSRVLVLVLAVSALHGMSTEGFDRLWPLHLLVDVGVPALDFDRVVWFGVIQAGGLALASLASEVVKRRVDLASNEGAARALSTITVLLVVSVIGFAYAGSFAVAVAALWSVTLLREINQPVFSAWLNQGLDSRTRATVNSMASQFDALGQIAGGPVLGVLAAARSVHAAIVVAGVARAPALVLFARAVRLGRDRAAAPGEGR